MALEPPLTVRITGSEGFGGAYDKGIPHRASPLGFVARPGLGRTSPQHLAQGGRDPPPDRVVSRVSTKTGMGTSGHPGRGSPQVASGTSHGRHGPPQPVAAPSNRLDHSTVPSWMQVEARISRISPLSNPFRFRWSQHLRIPVLPFLRPSCIPVSSRYSTPLHAAAHFCHRG